MTEFAQIASRIDEQLAKSKRAEQFFEIVTDAFTEVVNERLYVEGLNSLLRQVLTEHRPVTAETTPGRFVVLHSTPLITWAVIFYDQPSNWLYLSPRNVLESSIGVTHSLRLNRYECNKPEDFAVLEHDNRLRPVAEEVAGKNQVYRREGFTQVFDWRAIPGSVSPAMTLRVNSHALAPFEWTFERTSLSPVSLSPAHVHESNLTTMLSLLAQAGNERTVALIEPLLRHERHFIRWNAAQAIAGINAGMGLEALKLLANDPHSEVRNSVAAVLATSQKVSAA